LTGRRGPRGKKPIRAEGKRKLDAWFAERPMNIIFAFAKTHHPENYLFHSRATVSDGPGEKERTEREAREQDREQ
jgi:hypothetical protein